MPLIVAWECPRTGQLFKDKASYRKHLRDQVIIRRKERARAQGAERLKVLFTDLRTRTSFADIEEWWLDHFDEVYRLQEAKRVSRDDRLRVRDWIDPPELTSFKLKGLSFSPDLINTHHAPDGKPRNWHRDPSIAMGYPGWNGTLVFTYKGTFVSFPSHFLEGSGIRVLGGNGNGSSYQCRVTLFAEDFLAMFTYEKLMGTVR